MITIPGKIKGKARPRVYNGHAFTPKDTVNYENWVKQCYIEQSNTLYNGALSVEVIAYHSIPKSYSKKRIEGIKRGLEYPTKKPDADNIAKIILDSLNGIAFKDDSQVVDLVVLKRYADQEHVTLEIKEMQF